MRWALGWFAMVLLGAQDTPERRVEATPAKAAKSEPVFLRVPFWADGEQAVPPEDLRVTVNGQPAKLVRLLGPDADMVVLIVLDLSGDLALADPARDSLIAALAGLPANTYAGLLRAQDGLRVLVDPGPDRSPVETAIREVPITGRSGLLETVEAAVQLGDLIQRRALVRLAVFYLTDSTIYNYRDDYTNPVVNSSDSRDMSRRFPEGLIKEKTRQLAGQLGHSQSPLFVLHVNYQNDRLNEAYQTGLMELAAATGGAAQFCRSVAEIPPAVASMIQQLSRQYTAVVEKTGSARQADVTLMVEGRSPKYRERFLTKKR